jgi:hypothetical protein
LFALQQTENFFAAFMHSFYEVHGKGKIVSVLN